MKGFLSLQLLWMINQKVMTGAEITEEIEKRRETKPSPGTIYPALGNLKEKGLVSCDKKKSYSLTTKGKKELDTELKIFFKTFCDVDKMKQQMH